MPIRILEKYVLFEVSWKVFPLVQFKRFHENTIKVKIKEPTYVREILKPFQKNLN